MTPYAYLRDTLTHAYRMRYYDLGSENYADDAMGEQMHLALTWVGDTLYNNCKTRRDWDTALHRLEGTIRRAAGTASHHDASFIVAVLRDFYDADFYDVYIDAIEYLEK